MHRAFDWIFAPWLNDMGFTDLTVREGFASLRLPPQDKLGFFSGAVCGQAIMAAIDAAASLAMFTVSRFARGTVYRHTHFLRPAADDSFVIEAEVLRLGKASAYVECGVRSAVSGKLVARGVLDFAL